MKKYFIITTVFLSVFSFFSFAHAANADTFTYLDTNSDARVDTVRWTSNGENFTGCTYSSNDWVINNAGTIGITAITGVSCSGVDNILNISVTASQNITGGSINPVISYTAANYADLVGEGGYFPATTNQNVLDNAAPKVLSVSPTNSSTNQSISAPIIINFSEPMTVYSVYVSSSPSSVYSPVWSSDSKTVTFSHSNYAYNQKIDMSLTSGSSYSGPIAIQNLPYQWSFNTAVNTTPSGEFASSVYLDKNGDGTVDTIRWTTTGEYIGCTYSSNDWVINNAGTIGITAITGVSCNNTTIMDISVTAASGVTGGSTNPVISYTAANYADLAGEGGYFSANYNQTTTDGAGPKVLSVSPANGSSNQSISAPIVVNFSEPMNSSFVTISSSPSFTYSPVWSSDAKTVTYSHSNYSSSQQINLSASGASSTGLIPSPTYNWSFTVLNTNNTGGGGGGGGGGNYQTGISNMTLSINGSSPTTTNTMATLAINATNASYMMIANDSLFTNATWIPYSNTMTWILTSGAGMKTVYIKFKDTYGNISNPISANINLNSSEIKKDDPDGKTYTFTKTLNKRSAKQTIKNMQIVLNYDVGNLLPKLLYTDGSWGNKTTNAIKIFQSKHNLYPDGIPGKKTRDELSKIIVK